MRTYRKDRIESVEVVFDFTAYLAGIDDTIVVYTSLADPGIVIDGSKQVGGQVILTVGGGEYDVAYLIGVSIISSEGTVKALKARMIVRGLHVPQSIDDPLILVDGVTGPVFGDT